MPQWKIKAFPQSPTGVGVNVMQETVGNITGNIVYAVLSKNSLLFDLGWCPSGITMSALSSHQCKINLCEHSEERHERLYYLVKTEVRCWVWRSCATALPAFCTSCLLCPGLYKQKHPPLHREVSSASHQGSASKRPHDALHAKISEDKSSPHCLGMTFSFHGGSPKIQMSLQPRLFQVVILFLRKHYPTFPHKVCCFLFCRVQCIFTADSFTTTVSQQLCYNTFNSTVWLLPVCVCFVQF